MLLRLPSSKPNRPCRPPRPVPRTLPTPPAAPAKPQHRPEPNSRPPPSHEAPARPDAHPARLGLTATPPSARRAPHPAANHLTRVRLHPGCVTSCWWFQNAAQNAPAACWQSDAAAKRAEPLPSAGQRGATQPHATDARTVAPTRHVAAPWHCPMPIQHDAFWLFQALVKDTTYWALVSVTISPL